MPDVITMVSEIFFREQGIPPQLAPLVLEQDPCWYCADKNGEIVGVIASFREDGQAHMGRLAVRQDMRGHHIAAALLEHVLLELFAQGAEKVCTVSRPAAAHLLEKMGGSVVGEAYQFYNDICIPVDVLCKDFHPLNSQIT